MQNSIHLSKKTKLRVQYCTVTRAFEDYVYVACDSFQCKVWLTDRLMDTLTDRHMDRQTPDKVISISRYAKHRWQKNDTRMSVCDKSTIHSRISGDWRWHIRISENSSTLPFLLSLKKKTRKLLINILSTNKGKLNEFYRLFSINGKQVTHSSKFL